MNMVLLGSMLTLVYIYNMFRTVLRFLMPRSLRKKKDIAGQKVLITGAGSGLGRQLALKFSKLSTCLVLLDIDEEALRQTSRLLVLHQPGCRVSTYKCDISDRKMVYAVAEKVKDDVGDIDIVVNNAGIVTGKSFIDLPDEKIVKTMEVNALSHFWICKSFLPAMMAKNSGHIVAVTSIAGLFGSPRLTDYCASKYAAIGFSESLELELRAKKLDGIRVTIVCPGHMNTELFDGLKVGFGRIVTAEEVAKEIVDGILEDRELIIYPSYWAPIVFFKTISPRWISTMFYEHTNSLPAMDNFRGKTSTQNSSIHAQSSTNGVKRRN